jgi:hypothetical protein
MWQPPPPPYYRVVWGGGGRTHVCKLQQMPLNTSARLLSRHIVLYIAFYKISFFGGNIPSLKEKAAGLSRGVQQAAAEHEADADSR